MSQPETSDIGVIVVNGASYVPLERAQRAEQLAWDTAAALRERDPDALALIPFDKALREADVV